MLSTAGGCAQMCGPLALSSSMRLVFAGRPSRADTRTFLCRRVGAVSGSAIGGAPRRQRIGGGT
eukprot:3454187-Prymnesium_polylepis.1